MAIRCVVVVVGDGHGGLPLSGDDLASVVESVLATGRRVGVLRVGAPGGGGTEAPAVPGAFELRLPLPGIADGDPNLLTALAALGGSFPRELLVVFAADGPWAPRSEAAGARSLAVDGGPVQPGARPAGGASRGARTVGLLGEIERLEQDEAEVAAKVGVGPHAEPWPDDPRLDPELLAQGDRRNVIDRYRYWREEAIVADLEARRLPFHVAIENWQHDLNIGTVVRNANAFNAAGVHIVGRRRWNRRGAMATDRYLSVRHHGDVDAFVAWAAGEGLAIVGIDNVDGAIDLDRSPLPSRCVLVFGQEGPGLSDAMRAGCDEIRAIAQYGSTRSLNAGVASGIAMHAWSRSRPDLTR